MQFNTLLVLTGVLCSLSLADPIPQSPAFVSLPQDLILITYSRFQTNNRSSLRHRILHSGPPNRHRIPLLRLCDPDKRTPLQLYCQFRIFHVVSNRAQGDARVGLFDRITN